MPNIAGMVFLSFGGGVIKINRVIAVVAAAIILLMFLQSGVYAAGAATVYADKVTAKPGETVLIPVKIKDNPRMMGFKITVAYPAEIFSQPKAMRGNVTTDGLFNDSITQATNGSFDVVWSCTENVKSDGTLFTLQFTVADGAKAGKYEILLSYSQPDTFNEKWEDVQLDCKAITISIVSDDNVQTNTESGGAAISNYSGQTAAPVQTVTQPQTTQTVEEIKAEYVSDVLLKIDSDDVIEAVNKTAKDFGAESVSDVPKDKQADFVKAVEERLKSLAPDVESFDSVGLNTLQAFEAIEQLSQSAEEYSTEGVNVSEAVAAISQGTSRTASTAKWIAGTVIAAISIFVAFAVLKYRKSKNTYKADNIKEEKQDEKQ